MTSTSAAHRSSVLMPATLLAILLCVQRTVCLSAAEPRVLFEEKFSDQLDKDWSWLREDRSAWRLDKGALVLDTLPQGPGPNNKPRNALLRPSPTANNRFAVEVHLDFEPQKKAEFAGLVLYFDDDNNVICGRQHLDGKPLLVEACAIEGKAQPTFSKEHDAKTVWLRLEASGTYVVSMFRDTETEEWTYLGEVKQPPSQKPMRVGLLSSFAPKKPDRQARFESFRLLEFYRMSTLPHPTPREASDDELPLRHPELPWIGGVMLAIGIFILVWGLYTTGRHYYHSWSWVRIQATIMQDLTYHDGDSDGPPLVRLLVSYRDGSGKDHSPTLTCYAEAMPYTDWKTVPIRHHPRKPGRAEIMPNRDWPTLKLLLVFFFGTFFVIGGSLILLAVHLGAK